MLPHGLCGHRAGGSGRWEHGGGTGHGRVSLEERTSLQSEGFRAARGLGAWWREGGQTREPGLAEPHSGGGKDREAQRGGPWGERGSAMARAPAEGQARAGWHVGPRPGLSSQSHGPHGWRGTNPFPVGTQRVRSLRGGSLGQQPTPTRALWTLESPPPLCTGNIGGCSEGRSPGGGEGTALLFWMLVHPCGWLPCGPHVGPRRSVGSSVGSVPCPLPPPRPCPRPPPWHLAWGGTGPAWRLRADSGCDHGPGVCAPLTLTLFYSGHPAPLLPPPSGRPEASGWPGSWNCHVGSRSGPSCCRGHWVWLLLPCWSLLRVAPSPRHFPPRAGRGGLL